jgi:hypothetical protein
MTISNGGLTQRAKHLKYDHPQSQAVSQAYEEANRTEIQCEKQLCKRLMAANLIDDFVDDPTSYVKVLICKSRDSCEARY